jgi:hypothetical protein
MSAMTWSDLVPNRRAVFDPYYDELPELAAVRVRSVHIDGWTPAVTVRIDLPRYPDRWERGDGDTAQCLLRFVGVESFLMKGWRPPVEADFTFTELPGNRIAVRGAGGSLDLSFVSDASVEATGLSVFVRGGDGGDDGTRHFAEPGDE